MKFLVPLCLFSAATAFHVQPQRGVSRVVARANKGNQQLDISRAKECAENFGHCSVEEMQVIKEDLHQERLRNMVFVENPSTPASNDMFEHRILEEELELQLNLLQTATPDSSFFPKDEDEMVALPHLKGDNLEKSKHNPVLQKAEDFVHSAEDFVHTAEVVALEQESRIDGETMEATAICLVIAALVFAPQFFHF